MSSLRLTIECHQRGLLSKEAAEAVLEKREDLIKGAMRKQAAALIDSIQRLEDHTKEAGFLSGRGQGGGFLSKFKSGGKSPGGGWSDVLSNLTKMTALAGLAAGATTGAGALIQHSRDRRLRGRIQESYKQMFEEEPDLKEHLDDPDRRRTLTRDFGILSEVAPSLAAIPSVAGLWLRSKQTQPRIEPSEIGNLADIQRKIDEMHETHRGAGPKLAPLAVHGLVTGAMGGGAGGDRDHNKP